MRAGMCGVKLEYPVIMECERVLSCHEDVSKDTEVGRKGSFYWPYLGQFEGARNYGCEA